MPRRLALFALFALFALIACAPTREPAREEAPAPAKAEAPAPASEEAEEAELFDTEAETGTVIDEADEADEADDAEEDGDEDEAEADARWMTVKPGESLSAILHRAGLSASEAHGLITALAGHLDPATIQPGQRYALTRDDAELTGFAFATSTIRSIVATRDDGGAWQAEEREADTVIVEEALGGVVERSLWAAVQGAGGRPALISMIVDVFAYDIDFFTETRPGDSFRVLVERIEAGGAFVRYGRLVAAEYTSGDAVHRMFWWRPPGSTGDGGYFDEDGHGVARSFLKSPLKFTRVSSSFNPKRFHPILHRVKGHMGVDYAAPEGTPVWAAASGTISYRGRKGGAGNMVVMRHEGGLSTLYMHLSKFAKGQRVGQKIAQKTVIGYVGATGLATGPHLHFGVTKGGRYVDPMSVDRHRAAGIPAEHRARFKKDVAALAARLEAVALPGQAASDAPTPAGDAPPSP